MIPIWIEHKEKNGALVPALKVGVRTVRRTDPNPPELGPRNVTESVYWVFSHECAQPYKIYLQEGDSK